MGRIIGIDLGTTYSVVTIPEDLTGEGFLSVKQNPGYTVVLDNFKRRTTPSVISCDKKGNIIAGHKAKNRAGMSPSPIMFAKRYMGEDKTFELTNEKSLDPEEVSTEILRHLKSMAEDRLGESVEDAVITVPAYFSLKAKQLTESAGQKAGLNVKKIAQEPVAAALVYTSRDDRDPLTIMTYDLGGGTFDVAILKKRDGTISADSILAFDGERFLGGYNFDKKLALWMMDKLASEGYDFSLDLENPLDFAIFAKLMVYAERAKLALSKTEVYEFSEISTGIVDHSGEDVTIEFEISRDDFNALIKEDIAYSVSICQRCLEKTSLNAEDLDEIIMVGGSSYIPLISECIEAAFAKKPQLFEPDLCVAIGAGILAGSVDTGELIDGCLQISSIPKETDLPDLFVTGQVIKSANCSDIQGCTVALKTTDGSYNSKRVTNDQGIFTFESVPLIEDDITDFILTLMSNSGEKLASHRFSVEQSANVDGGLIGGGDWNVLSKPINILGVKGINTVFPEGTTLPAEQQVAAITSDQTGSVKIPIIEGNEQLGVIEIDNLPTTLPIGSDIEITLTANKNYQIIGKAFLPFLKREEAVVIDVPVPPARDIDDLRREFELLEEQSQDALNSAGIVTMFKGANAKRLQERLEHCRKLFQSRKPESVVIQSCMSEIENLIKSLSSWKPDPPRDIFNKTAQQTDKILADLIQAKPELKKDGYDKLIETIRKNAEKAYENQNSIAWKQECDKMAELLSKLNRMKNDLSGGSGGGGSNSDSPEIDPKALLFQLSLMLKKSKEEVQAEDPEKYKKHENEFEELGAELQAIKPDASDVMSRIQDWYKKFNNFISKISVKGVGLPDFL
jgi:molecular chaperone DnaK